MISITSKDFLAILPALITTLFGIYLMVHGVFLKEKKHRTILYVALLGLVFAIVSNFFLIGESFTAFNGMVKVDRISVFFNFLFLATSGLTLLISISYSEQQHIEFIEYSPLILFATVGMMLMGSAASLMIIFLGLETMSIALYVLAGFRRTHRESLEAALKYFLLGAFATGFLLYGIALTYGSVGSTNLSAITNYFAANSLNLNLLSLLGLGLMLIGFGFKVALVPFHMWTPDVYQGSPMPVTAFMAVGAKAAGFAAIIRVISISASQISFELTEVLWVLAVLTMTIGNIIALVQNDIKRMLAYSSIAHAGYILVGIVAANDLSVPGVLFYLAAYLFMNLGAFAIASSVSGKNERRVKIEYFRGLGFSQPTMGFAMALCMFSLAGFPPTAGFMGKFYLFSAALQSGFVWLVIIGVLNSLLSVYYYIRVVVAMYMEKPLDDTLVTQIVPGVGLVILISIIGILYLGIFPGSLMAMMN
jgi:NADH-quinone oxidoreductase subunit N